MRRENDKKNIWSNTSLIYFNIKLGGEAQPDLQYYVTTANVNRSSMSSVEFISWSQLPLELIDVQLQLFSQGTIHTVKNKPLLEIN